MLAPLLATKLHIPAPRPQMVPRPHLLARLNEGPAAGCKLTLISASAGFGKTTLLSEWISAFPLGVKVSWLSLDEADSDPTRCLLYLVSSLQTVAPNLGEGLLAALQTPQPPPAEALLTGLLNEIATLSGRYILILDDYHLLDSPAVDSTLAFLLDHLPSQLHLVIASREDPNLALSRLRARGQLTELRTADLRFTPAEAAEFLNHVMGLKLSETDVAALEARTEGWIAGLQLAALAMQAPLSLQGQKDTASFIQSFTGSHRFVLDYLLEEVLNQQPPEIQAFLLRTSILNRLCGPLCDAILEAPPVSGQATLEALEHANLFLVPLDNQRRWYRYHHLFSDLLRQRLDTLPPSGERRREKAAGDLHLRASQWHEDNGDLAEAFHHAHAARDFERAARLAEAAWPGMQGSFQSAAWVGWAKKLPEPVVYARPVLCLQLGRAFSDLGEPDTSEIYLQNTERALTEVPERAEFTSMPGDIALTRAYNAQVQGDVARTIRFAEQALRLIPAKDVLRRAQAVIMLEFTHWASGDLEASLRAIRNWIADMRTLDNSVFAIASAFAEADLLVEFGRLRDAIHTYRQAIQLADENGPEAQAITAHHHLGLALIYHEMGDVESAAAHLETAADLGQRTPLVDWPYRWNVGQARLKESAGQWDAALELLDGARRGYVKNPVPIARPVEAMQARIHLKQGRRDKAEAWVRERGISFSDEASYLAEYELLTLARLRLDDPGVHPLLERLLTLAKAQNRQGSVLDILLTQTLAHQSQACQAQALTTLERALSLAAPQGYLRIFVDEGEKVRLMIADYQVAIERQSHPLLAYIDKLLSTFPQPEIENQKSEILSPRELEILQLVAQGLSNTEISQRLYLALSTVKGHNLRIFAKLQAQNRTEAVARARELGLL
ncbi:MAG: hypothetical protein JW987_01745 [Anaerolineaceae bacterium]|nr:hypothetical protein [Anaerolineaceae bacterium]